MYIYNYDALDTSTSPSRLLAQIWSGCKTFWGFEPRVLRASCFFLILGHDLWLHGCWEGPIAAQGSALRVALWLGLLLRLHSCLLGVSVKINSFEMVRPGRLTWNLKPYVNLPGSICEMLCIFLFLAVYIPTSKAFTWKKLPNNETRW